MIYLAHVIFLLDMQWPTLRRPGKDFSVICTGFLPLSPKALYLAHIQYTVSLCWTTGASKSLFIYCFTFLYWKLFLHKTVTIIK